MTEADEGNQVRPGGYWGSPNAVPTMIAQMVLRLSHEPAHRHQEIVRQDALVSVFLGMSAIEAFANAYGRVVADEVGGASGQALEKVIKKKQSNTYEKLKALYAHGFKKPLDEKDPRWVEYDKLRTLRNHFVHFKTTHTTVHIPSIGTMKGMADLKELEKLTVETPGWALKTMRGLVEFVGEGRGLTKQQAAGLVHSYLGLVPGT